MGRIITRSEEKGLTIAGLKLMRIDSALAERHYAPHKGKPFYPGLIDYVTSGPVVVMAVSGTRAIDISRQLMGATFGFEAQPGTIRGDFGASKTFNLIHGIDAPDMTQTCRLTGQAAGQSWTCGRDARWAAINRIHPHWVSCDARGRDPQGTELAVCYLAGFGQHELNVWLVAQGWALAAPGAPPAYAVAQAAAEAAGRGLWRSDFVPPGAWRRGQRLP